MARPRESRTRRPWGWEAGDGGTAFCAGTVSERTSRGTRSRPRRMGITRRQPLQKAFGRERRSLLRAGLSPYLAQNGAGPRCQAEKAATGFRRPDNFLTRFIEAVGLGRRAAAALHACQRRTGIWRPTTPNSSKLVRKR